MSYDSSITALLESNTNNMHGSEHWRAKTYPFPDFEIEHADRGIGEHQYNRNYLFISCRDLETAL